MIEIRIARTDDVSGEHLTEISALLVRAFVDDFSDDDWRHCLGGWHITAHDGGELVSHAAVVERILAIGTELFRVGYVEAVATEPRRQRQGIGAAVMHRVNSVISHHYEMGALATGAHDFYRRLGWERWQGRTFVRGDHQPSRTEDDDDAIMILRCTPSQNVDVTQSICCEARPGDPW